MWNVMNPPRARTAPSALMPAGPATARIPGDTADYVAVDDGGTFAYYRTAAALCTDFEYVGQTESIIDRNANQYPLMLDAGRRITLGRSIEKADLPWLRAAWARAQDASPRLYPLHRLLPWGAEIFVQGLFEVLELSAGYEPAGGDWTVTLGARDSRVGSLAGLTALLLAATDLSGALVEDPYGHHYRPARGGRHGLALTGRRYVAYTEVPAGNSPG
ncbi:MAG: hypothetical protein ACHP7K_07855 [Actinomycetales bacterium]